VVSEALQGVGALVDDSFAGRADDARSRLTIAGMALDEPRIDPAQVFVEVSGLRIILCPGVISHTAT
jgi:hypothetical protein